MPSSGSRLKRNLGGLLAKLRAEAKLDAHDVYPHLDRSQSSLSRIENGITAPTEEDLKVFRRLYNPTAEAWAPVEDAFEEVRADKKRLVLPVRMQVSDSFRRYLKAERSARKVTTFQPLVVPGLLQIEAYTRRVVGVPPLEEGEGQAQTAIRIWRQELVESGELELHAYIDEAVVHRTRALGADGVAQLEHLLMMAEKDNVMLGVVPFSSGVHALMTGPIVLLEFAREKDPAEAYLEYTGGSGWASEAGVPRLKARLDSTIAKALPGERSMDLIARAARTKTR